MWVVMAALLLAAPAAEVLLDSTAVVDQQVPHAGKSLLPQHQQLLADATSTPLLDKLLAVPKKNSSKTVVHSAVWEAKHAVPPQKKSRSALWEASHSETKTSSSKVELRKTIQGKDDDPKDQKEQGKQGKQEGQQGQHTRDEWEPEGDGEEAGRSDQRGLRA